MVKHCQGRARAPKQVLGKQPLELWSPDCYITGAPIAQGFGLVPLTRLELATSDLSRVALYPTELQGAERRYGGIAWLLSMTQMVGLDRRWPARCRRSLFSRDCFRQLPGHLLRPNQSLIRKAIAHGSTLPRAQDELVYVVAEQAINATHTHRYS
jgi:hypothetical protein